MERILNTKFYLQPQSFSGHIIKDEECGVGEYMIMECINRSDIFQHIEYIDEKSDFDLFYECECCGSRWGSYGREIIGETMEELKIYLEEHESIVKEGCYIHFLDNSFINAKKILNE